MILDYKGYGLKRTQNKPLLNYWYQAGIVVLILAYDLWLFVSQF